MFSTQKGQTCVREQLCDQYLYLCWGEGRGEIYICNAGISKKQLLVISELYDFYHPQIFNCMSFLREAKKGHLSMQFF
jgi:hypothetical protein